MSTAHAAQADTVVMAWLLEAHSALVDAGDAIAAVELALREIRRIPGVRGARLETETSELEPVGGDGSWAASAGAPSVVLPLLGRRGSLGSIVCELEGESALVPYTQALGSLVSALAFKLEDLAGKGSEPLNPAHLETVLEVVSSMLVVTDAQGVIQVVNEQAASMLGTSRGALAGTDFVDAFFPEGEHEMTRAQLDMVMAGVPVTDLESTVQGVGGPVSVRWSLKRIDGGDEGMVACGIDLTQRRESESALQAQRELLQAVMDNAQTIMCLIDRDGRFLMVNRKFESVFHIGARHAIGSKIVEVLPTDVAAKYLRHLAGTIRHRQAVTFEETRTLADGSMLHLLTTFFPLYAHDTDVSGVGVIATDISAQMRSVLNLNGNEEIFRSLTAVSPAGILLADADGACVFANERAQKMTGRDLDQLSGEGWLGAVHQQDRETVSAYWRETVTSGNPWQLEFRFTGAGETERWVLGHGGALVADESSPLRFVIVCLETGERRGYGPDGTNQRLRDRQRLEGLGVLAGGIAHQFNNILMGVLGNADLAISMVESGSPARQPIRNIKRAAQQAAGLARQMLAYAGKGKLVVQTIDLDAVVAEMEPLLRASISKKAMLKLELAGGLPTVLGDVSQIQQVIVNLLVNASEALGDGGGTIRVATRQGPTAPGGEQPTVVLEVEDDGCGMDPTTSQHLFDPFFTTKVVGRGLGMSAVLGIVQAHAGTIDIETEPGAGTKVRVMLPVVGNGARAAGERRSKSPQAPLGPRQGSVLLVDDDPVALMTAEQMLIHLGREVLVARSGRDALQQFEEHRGEIGCIVLDLTMPEMDGEETMNELRLLGCDQPVIMASGFDLDEVAPRFETKGVAGFLQKPYTLKSLSSALTRAAQG